MGQSLGVRVSGGVGGYKGVESRGGGFSQWTECQKNMEYTSYFFPNKNAQYRLVDMYQFSRSN